jgi:hypothetical protein
LGGVCVCFGVVEFEEVSFPLFLVEKTQKKAALLSTLLTTHSLSKVLALNYLPFEPLLAHGRAQSWAIV